MNLTTEGYTMKIRYKMKDRSRGHDAVTGTSLDAMATRMFGRRATVLAEPGTPDGSTATVATPGGVVIGEVVVYKA